MATVDKTFSFASDAEGLTDQVQSGVVFAWLSSDGSPANGCVRFTQATKSVTQTESAVQTGKVWTDWGVPAGATVTHMQLISMNEKLATNTKLSSHNFRVNVRDASVYVGSGWLYDAALGTTVDSSWQAIGAGTQQTIDAGKGDSTDPANLYLEYTVTTSGGGGNAAVDQRVDEIVIRLTYTVSVPEHFIAANLNLGLAMGAALTRETFVAANFPLNLEMAVALFRETFIAADLPLSLQMAVNLTVGPAGPVEHFIAANLPLGLQMGANLTREMFVAANLPLGLTVDVNLTRETFIAASLDLQIEMAIKLILDMLIAAGFPLGIQVSINLTVEGQGQVHRRGLLGIGV